MAHQLRLPAPRRCSVEGPMGTYHTVAWTREEVLKYRRIGGWFVKNWHDFADRAAAKAAGVDFEEAQS